MKLKNKIIRRGKKWFKDGEFLTTNASDLFVMFNNSTNKLVTFHQTFDEFRNTIVSEFTAYSSLFSFNEFIYSRLYAINKIYAIRLKELYDFHNPNIISTLWNIIENDWDLIDKKENER